MKKLALLALLLLNCMLFGVKYHPNTLIVKTTHHREILRGKFGLKDFDDYLERYEVKEVKSILPKADNRYYLIHTFEPIDFEEMERKRFAGVEYTQPNYMNRMFVDPNDPLYHQQLLGNVNLPQAWNYAVGSDEIVIAVIDSGLHFDHPDLQKNIWYNELEIPDSGVDDDGNGYIDDWRGWDFVDAPEWEAIAFGDFVDQDNEPFDDLNHGTHVAGIIGATANNDEGIAGVCWNVKLMILRAGFQTTMGGFLQDDDAAAALFYAADMGADVISLSWGDNNYSPIIADACQYAYDKGAIIVAAAGNDGSAPIVYPARLSTTIAVGAVDANNRRASFSSYGPNLDLVAPGVGIISTFDTTEGNLYQIQSGTSMAVPFVSGAIGLLLSEEPGLSFEEVKARLAASCHNLGSFGYNIEFGYGLLDVYRLLTNQQAPIVKITSPIDYQAFSESFAIEGTVMMDGFTYYSVMYTTESEPENVDWKNVNNHNNTPYWYYDEVENGTLATFNAVQVTPELQEYLIRIRAYDSLDNQYEYKRTIKIDKTPPVFYPDRTGFEKRYDGENSVYYLQTVYNKPVIQRLELTNGMFSYEIVAARYDSIHVHQLPDYAENGVYSVQYHAESEVGLTISGDIPFDVKLDHYSVDTNEFEQINLPQTLLINRYYADFDGNGKYEFLAYETEDNINVASVYEVSGDSIVYKHTFPEFIVPRAIGNTNNAGMEILGIVGEDARLYEVAPGNVYPNQQQVIYNWPDTRGADFIDYDGDGRDEVALVMAEVPGSTRWVVRIYKRVGSSFSLMETLHNVSPGVPERNVFVPKVVAGNFKGGGVRSVLTADQEGDVMIFENGELVWMRRSPVPNTFFLGAGNFLNHNDGRKDFCVGGYAFNPDNPALNVAIFEFFTWDSEMGTFKKTGYVSFDDIAVRNSITIADITGDGLDEIIIDVPPNIYIVAYDELSQQFRPIWKGDSASELSNTIVAFPSSDSQPAHIVANRKVNGELKTNLIRSRETTYTLSAPQLFNVQPMNESDVRLTWRENIDAGSYRIERKHEDDIEVIAEVTGTVYVDDNLIAGETYWYRVSSYNENESPPESLPTLWKEAIPYYPPKVESITMISNNEVKIVFDRELRNDALIFSNFHLNNDYGFPHSTNWVYGHNGIILNFMNYFINPALSEDIEEYQLTIRSLYGRTGVPYQEEPIISFDFQIDVEPPYIVKAEQKDERSIAVFFNEELDRESAENWENYSLSMPVSDSENSIELIEYHANMNDYIVTITLKNKPALTNQEYFLKVNRVTDLAGNTISNSGNKITFSLNDISKLSQHVVAPNPFETKLHSEIRFFLPIEQSGNIAIYDLSGAKVFEDTIQPLSRLRNFYAWNGRNANNQRVSSGLYLYIIKAGNEIVRGKIAVIN